MTLHEKCGRKSTYKYICLLQVYKSILWFTLSAFSTCWNMVIWGISRDRKNKFISIFHSAFPMQREGENYTKSMHWIDFFFDIITKTKKKIKWIQLLYFISIKSVMLSSVMTWLMSNVIEISEISHFSALHFSTYNITHKYGAYSPYFQDPVSQKIVLHNPNEFIKKEKVWKWKRRRCVSC